MELLKPTVDTDGLGCDHNMPCCIYPDRPAVLLCNSGIFIPSSKAQAEGWVLVKVPKKKRFLRWLLNKYAPGGRL